jgi:hypothetical protein
MRPTFVAVMQIAHLGERDDLACRGQLYATGLWTILVEREMFWPRDDIENNSTGYGAKRVNQQTNSYQMSAGDGRK